MKWSKRKQKERKGKRGLSRSSREYKSKNCPFLSSSTVCHVLFLPPLFHYDLTQSTIPLPKLLLFVLFFVSLSLPLCLSLCLSLSVCLSSFPSLSFYLSYVVSPLGLHTTPSLPHIPVPIRFPINLLRDAVTIRTWRLSRSHTTIYP
jgi:hypothetical protein